MPVVKRNRHVQALDSDSANKMYFLEEASVGLRRIRYAWWIQNCDWTSWNFRRACNNRRWSRWVILPSSSFSKCNYAEKFAKHQPNVNVQELPLNLTIVNPRYLPVENWVYVVIKDQHHGISTPFRGIILEMRGQTSCWTLNHRCFFMDHNISWEWRLPFTMVSIAMLVSERATISKQVVTGRTLLFSFTGLYVSRSLYGCENLALPLSNGYRHWALYHACRIHFLFRRAFRFGCSLQMCWCMIVPTEKHLKNA